MIHIEFVGVNGAGKSTLYHQSNAYLAARLGYKPGPDKLWLRMVDDEALQPASIRNSWAFRLLRRIDGRKKIMRRLPVHSENNFGLLSRAALRNSELIRRFIQLDADQPGSTLVSSPDAYGHWNLQYFFTLLTFYQSCLESADRQLLMLDEGFVSLFSEYLAGDDGVDDRLLSALLENDVAVDCLFHVTADVKTCVDRLAIRGVPAPYRHLSPPALGACLSRRDAEIKQVCHRLAATRTRVVEVPNDDSSQAAFALVRPHLDSIVGNLAAPVARPLLRA